jgi:hAT family C-terminal dimerisation region
MLACFVQRILECTLKGNTKPNWQLNSEVQHIVSVTYILKYFNTYILKLMLAFLYDVVIIRAGSGATHSVNDTRAGLKDFLSGKRTTEITKSELDQYLDDPLDETSLDDDFDILTWWKLKSQTYPVMAKLTRDILAVPISTMASESTFSTSGRILSPV